MLCVVALLLSTPWGSHLTIILLNKSTAFSMEYQEGILLENIKLSYLSLNEEQLSIDAKGIVLKLNPKCLWQQKLCLDELAMQSFTVKSAQTSEQDENKLDNAGVDVSVEKFVFPFAIKADKLFVKKLLVKVDGITITGNNITSKALLDNSSLALFTPNINVLSLTLSDSAPENSSTNIINAKGSIDNNTLWPMASLPTISLPIDLLIDNAQVRQFILQPVNDLPQQQLNNSHFTLTWQTTELSIKHFETEHAVYGNASLQGTANFIAPYTLNVTTLSTLKNIELFSLFDGTKQDVQLNGDLSALTFTSQLTGDIELTAKGTIDLTKKALPFSSNIILSKHPELERFLPTNTPVKASITANGDVNKQEFVINSVLSAYGYQDAELSLQASHQGNNLTLDNFTFNDKQTKSELRLQGEVNYSDELSWRLTLASFGFTLPAMQSQYANINGRLSGNIDITGENNSHKWSLQLKKSAIEGIINNIPVSAVGDIELDNIQLSNLQLDSFQLDNLKLNNVQLDNLKLNNIEGISQWQLKPSHLTLTAGDARLEINGFTDQNWHVSGELSVPALAQLITDSRGELSSTFTITGAITQPNLTFNNHLSHLYWQNIASPDVRLQGNYQPLQSHKLDLSLTSDEITWQNLVLSSFSAQLKGDVEQQNIKVNWLGDLAVNLSLTGTWLAKAKQWQSTLTKSDISFKGKPWQVDKNVEINYHQATNSLWIEQHCWQGKSIHLCSDTDITIANSGEIALLADIELKDVGDLFIPDDFKVTAKLHNKISLKWLPSQPINWSVATALSAGNIKLLKAKNLKEQPLTIAWQKGDAAFHLNNKVLTSHFLITPQILPAQQTQAKSALVDINTKIDFANDNRLSGKILIDDLNLFLLKANLSEVSQLNGLLNSNVNLSGSLSSPNFNGNMAITNTAVSFVRSQNALDNVAINLELLGKNAKLVGQGLINNDLVKITGELDWHQQFSALFNLNAEHLNLSHPPHISAVLAPNITLELTKQLLTLTGDINIKQGSLTINKLPAGSVSLSNDVIIVNDNGEEIDKTTRFAIATDLKVNIDDNVNISGYGFNGILGGKLLVKQQPHQDVQLFGNLLIVDGLYKAYGQRLAVSNGRASFNGPVENPSIDLRAIRYLPKENITAGIEIFGPANTLSVNLFSTPTKPKSEILSYIVRGRGLDTKTSSNGSLGFTLGATLANSSGILEQIEKLPFINNLEIEGDEQQASIAGYIGDNIYLKYGFGVAEPINELTVRFYLLNRLWLEAVSGLEQSADLYFSFDID